MAHRRKIIDRRTRAGRKLGRQIDQFQGAVILCIIGAVIAAAAFGDKSSKPAPSVAQSIISPAQAATSSGDGTASQSQTSKYPVEGSATTGQLAMNSIPRSTFSTSHDLYQADSDLPWRHVTDTGVRWSLRRAGAGSLLLLVDLGEGQVASVSVASAFERLDLAGMNLRVDQVRTFIAQNYPVRTSNFNFERDGSVRLIP